MGSSMTKKKEIFKLTRTLCVYFLTCVLSCYAFDGPRNITAEPGQTVTLTCRVTTKKLITVVEWRRPDLESGYVLLYRSGELDPEKQHPSFMNRVELKDKHLKEGDVSFDLKNITINDTGTYQCYVAEKGSGSQLITTINLTVEIPGDGPTKAGGDKDRDVGLMAGLPIAALFLVAVVAAVVFFKKWKT